jgi:2-polyprenyl-3-methyl-5-hydroxy-6-metoxy-1,4-benzoquinol methylase
MTKESESNFQNYFTKYAEEWSSSAHDGTYGYYPLGKIRLDKALSLISDNCLNGSEAIDFGSGPGLFARSLADIGFRVTGVDFSESMVERAKQNSGINTNVTFVHSEWETFSKGVTSESHDLVTALGFIYYLKDIESFASEVSRVLRPGGHFVVSFRNAEFSRAANLFEAQLKHYSLDNENLRRHFMESLIFGLQEGIQKIDTLDNMPQLTLPRHTEPEVTQNFAKLGLKKIETVGLHPHLLHPSLDNDQMIKLGDILSLPLDLVDGAPLNWFSHFITIFQKSPNS